MYVNKPIPMIGKINDNMAAGNIPKNLKLAGPIIEDILLTSQIFF
jgi:hypothetical protein